MEGITISALDRLKEIKQKFQNSCEEKRPLIIIGMGTCGLAAGAGDVHSAVSAYIKEKGIEAVIKPVGCIGYDEEEVLLDVKLSGQPRVTYGRVTPGMVPRIMEEHVLGGRIIQDWTIGIIEDEKKPYRDLPFYLKQERQVLARSGFINPEKIEDYLLSDGYKALAQVLGKMTGKEVIELVKESGLRGRGGAGFLTGLKWEFAAREPGDKKYVVCNADEGDPGAFMDRALLEGDPHALIEGMIIGAYAIGAQEGYIYVRAEYPLAIKRLRIAIAHAVKNGLLGENILGSGFSFQLKIKEGAGAFVCGEETALLNSIEGKRGMPRSRPPFPAQKGLWGKPTNINNVETWGNIPLILLYGGNRFKSLGTEGSSGTKIFALTGKVQKTGLVEVPMGTSIREIVYDIGGGIQNNRKFKAVQIGGPSGGCLPGELLDTTVDYDSLKKVGAMMGSGGMVVLDDSTCMVDFSRFFIRFIRRESCGKCTPCREGTQRMLEILTRIIEGHGEPEDLDKLQELGEVMRDAALCGLGQTAPNPVISTLRYFRDEYEAHINGHCPAGVCFSTLAQAGGKGGDRG